MTSSNGLAALECPIGNFLGEAATFGTTVALAAPLVSSYGITGAAGAIFARYCYASDQGKKATIHLPVSFWLTGIVAYVVLTLLLIHARSPFIASSSKLGITFAFWISVLGSITRRDEARTFWGACAISRLRQQR